MSKFRHLKGTFLPKATHIENIRNISQQLPKECDGFQGTVYLRNVVIFFSPDVFIFQTDLLGCHSIFTANPKRVAVPLSGPGGKIAIFELNKTGKLPDGVIPTLVNGTSIMDFAWDMFDYSRLAVGRY